MADKGQDMNEITIVCPKCASKSSVFVKCASCGQEFCSKCPGNHIPPAKNEIEAQVHFLYRMRGGTSKPWIEDVIRFTDAFPSAVCSACYESECNKAIWRLKYKIKNWKVGIVLEKDLKILEEAMPVCNPAREEPEMIKSAMDFLQELNKNTEK